MQYSNKVIEHFKNPHNMGAIENPDGLGQVGNPVCLTADSYIKINDHSAIMQDINISNKVLSYDGKYHKINKKFKRKYKGKIIEIKNRFGKITITPEHHVFALKIPKTTTFYHTKYKQSIQKNARWYHANELEKRDLILYPTPIETKNIDYININIKKPKYDFKSKNIPQKIKITNDFLRLAGYFIAEGNTSLKKCKNFITFTFHYKEKEYINDVNKLTKEIFKLETIVKTKKERKSTAINVYSAQLARFFANLFGTKAKNKQIPNFMLSLPQSKQKELIKGLWRGDGYFDSKKPRASFSTISKKLCEQLKTLLLRQQVTFSVYEEKERQTNNTYHQKAYRIHIGEKESLSKLSKILNISFKPNKKTAVNAWFYNNFIYLPITNIKIKEYNDYVYNLNVTKAHSYTTQIGAVHNCGDMMKLYIKVKDNKIEDIKFQTLGCAAAIATSSMITDLAKGKTIEQASKITRNDVSKALENLPPIKEHCSNLAADALQKAIEDYKKRNK